MPNRTITLGDGRAVQVDEDRYNAFDGMRGEIARMFAGDSRLMGRDAAEAVAFLIPQLAYTESMAYGKLYTPMQFRQLVPVTNEGGWAESIRYELFDYAGQGKPISGMGDDIPMAEAQYGARLFPIKMAGIGYQYTTEELQQSVFYRKPLPTARLEAALIGAERHLNQVALTGEASTGLTGLYNNASVPQGNAPTGGWASATPDNILKDVNALIMNIRTNTQFNDWPTTIAMAPTALAYISSTPRSANSDTTILEFLKRNNSAKSVGNQNVEFVEGYGLDTAGSGGTRRMIGYVKKESRLKMHIPLEQQFLAPQLRNLRTVVPSQYRYSGVEVRYIKSMYYMDNI